MKTNKRENQNKLLIIYLISIINFIVKLVDKTQIRRRKKRWNLIIGIIGISN
jgi:hypothetical protein